MSDSMTDVTERLFLEFAGQRSLTEIVEVVRECRAQLCCAPTAALPELVDRLARQRLKSSRHAPGRQNLASAAG